MPVDNGHVRHKTVFVSGGVISGLGKGVVASSLARLLRERGFRVNIAKFDPYLNADPGTMNPIQHGEVFVTDDGAETDLDLGHYERCLNQSLTRVSSVSAGQVYASVLSAERRGDYLGSTVQAIPHITGEIQRRIELAARPDPRNPPVDVVVVEVGGTVGDIEAGVFLEAFREYATEHPHDVAFVHLSLLLRLSTSQEWKTKPTQRTVRDLQTVGIRPDVLVCRCGTVPDDADREELTTKLSRMCGISPSAIAFSPDVHSISEIPRILASQGLDQVLCDCLGLTPTVTAEEFEAGLAAWDTANSPVAHNARRVTVGIVGKYTALPDAYLSVAAALHHAATRVGANLDINYIDADSADLAESLGNIDAIVVPGGFGTRGIEGKLETVRHARERNIPFLGLCLGLQCVVVEHARNVLGLDAASTEWTPGTPHPVVSLLEEQRGITQVGGTMRLGTYPAVLKARSKVASAYLASSNDASPYTRVLDGNATQIMIYERHRHRYEVNPEYLTALNESGLVISGTSPDGQLVEFVESEHHPFLVATQAHPEFKSRPEHPAPLFVALLKKIVE